MSSRQLTSGLSNDYDPRWHPGGKQIAFLSDRAKLGESSAIWSLRLDGGDAVPITPAENTQDIETFAFSPNGDTIAYVSVDEKSQDEKDKEEKEGPEPAVLSGSTIGCGSLTWRPSRPSRSWQTIGTST